ncbi:DUF222 domain-containing protein [Georgenia sp. AZ-5]|uniref:HNH endonuclease signature motif containing protein n=1 Tax=Georgenia sp. AZ-5 TaxID=3367526 RepID=UPI0037551EC2
MAPSATPAAVLATGIADLQRLLTELQDVDLHELPGEAVVEALDGLEQVRRKTEALTARALATIEADGMWALDGARSMAAWYRARSGKHQASAAREIRRARAMRDHLPQTAAALAAGTISVDHAQAMVRLAADTDVRRDRLRDPDVGEAFLLQHAKRLDASDFTVAVQQWGLRADPDAADRAYREDGAREEFYLAETTDGFVPGGWLSKTSGKLLMTALAARTGTPSRTDKRTPAQRRANALVGLAQLALDSGTLRPGARIRPHLAVMVPFETLQRLVAACAPRHRPGCRPTVAHRGAAFGLNPGRGLDPDLAGLPGGDRPTGPAVLEADRGTRGCTCGAADPEAVIGADVDASAMGGVEPATYDDGSPLPPSLLARLACGSQMHRVVFGPDSEVLDLGREERLFSAAQTRAIIARDKRCQYPNCNAPPGEGEIHHSLYWWAQFGSTNLRLGILLCWFHHDYVHAHGISIERRSGAWTFKRRDGSTVGSAAG